MRNTTKTRSASEPLDPSVCRGVLALAPSGIGENRQLAREVLASFWQGHALLQKIDEHTWARDIGPSWDHARVPVIETVVFRGDRLCRSIRRGEPLAQAQSLETLSVFEVAEYTLRRCRKAVGAPCREAHQEGN